MTDGSARELADEFGRTANLLGGRMTDRLGPRSGLSMPRANLLIALLRNGPAELGQLAESVGIAESTAAALIDSLAREALVDRHPAPDQGAASGQIALTTAGRAAARAWLDDYEQAAEEVFGPLPANLRPTLLAALRTLAEETGSADGRPRNSE